MKKNPKDLNVWLDFAERLIENKSIESISKSKKIRASDTQIDFDNTHTYGNHWNNLTQHMDWVNHKREQYIKKESPIYTKKKRLESDEHKSQHFIMTFKLEDEVLPLDRIDKKHFKKLNLHHITVVDLHGYTLPLAYERLKIAFQSAAQNKARILKVITGKGRTDSEKESPTLRQIFPKWMQETYFQNFLIKIRKAPADHGGEGAFLVYLKKNK